ncbi:hypothetical protein PMIT1323_00865 [Prochlorococcus marinus str. MIT 1323]|nr:hypothetical protein PMIT1323_00865 [Prochlorococcus marinus str. MIT 1323]
MTEIITAVADLGDNLFIRGISPSQPIQANDKQRTYG